MKRLSTIIMALAVILGMTQCEKPAMQLYDGSYTGVTKDITFSTGGSSKVTVDNSIASELHFKWQGTDNLYVYGSQTGDFSDGQYCGSLALVKGEGTENGFFSGTLDNVPTSGKLRFYYSATALDGTEKSIDLSSQDGSLLGIASHLVAYADVTVMESGDYSATLAVPYSVVKLDLHEFGSCDVTMTGTTNKGLTISEKGVKGVTAGTSTTLSGVTSGSTSYYVAVMPENVTTLNFSGGGKVGSKTVTLTENTFETLNGGGGGVPVPAAEPWTATVVTIPVCAIHSTCASSGGVVTGTGVEEQGVCWGTGANPTIAGSHYVHQYEYATGSFTPKTGSGNTFTGFMSGLTANTTYHVRAYIRKGSQVIYGDDITFTTSASEPEIQYVDLGLSVKWATCNLGATTPGGYGDYYQWGDLAACSTISSGTTYYVNCGWQSYRYAANSTTTFTKYCPSGKTSYWYNYSAGTNEPDGKESLGAAGDHYNYADDCVRQTLGGDWRMPTTAEWKELYNNTTRTWTTSGGVNGWRFTGKGSYTGVSLFLPAAGYFYGSSLDDAGSLGDFWSSSLYSSSPHYAYGMYFGSGRVLPQYYNSRYLGFTVRPVQ